MEAYCSTSEYLLMFSYALEVIALVSVTSPPMIPRFPEFKKINIDDKKSIEAYTHRYKPYSTFEFTNVLAWDIRDDRMVSELNENLVFRFTDYTTHEPFYSFLGSNESESTAVQLLHSAEALGVSSTLRFITEEAVRDLQLTGLHIEEDRDNFDYIFSTSQIAGTQGSKLKRKRHSARKFSREYPDATFEVKDLNDVSVQKQIFSVLRQWENKKKLDNKDCDLGNEEKAITRLLETANNHELILSGIFLHNTMLGFSIDEIVPHGYAMAHFIKADPSFKGIYEFFNQNLALYLVAHGIELWNWQQDLNIPGLRKVKMSYHPVNFLKKYRVSFN